MTVRDRIISYLQRHPEGVDDDDLADALGLSRRQHSNNLCRGLRDQGLIQRRDVDGKIRNFWVGGTSVAQPPRPSPKPRVAEVAPGAVPKPDVDKKQNWYWEGNVQARVVTYLAAQGCKIVSVADTASHQTGVDIIAEKSGTPLWVTVKGYPTGTAKTHPTVQAAHWFEEALFDVLEYRQDSEERLIAVALPDFPRYRSLAAKISWFKPVARFAYFWASENGGIDAE
jgi:hypothetical protein